MGQNLILEAGRPADANTREPVEKAVYDLLDELGVKYERVDHEAAFTMEACREIDAILAPAVICKNLFLCNQQKTKFYLLLIREDKKFKTKEITKQINSARLSFGPEEFLEKYLSCTPGSASVMGLMNDTDHVVQLLIDEDVLKEEYLACHPCRNTASLRFPVKDLVEKVLPAVDHDFMTVRLGYTEDNNNADV